ncbi:MAG: hypothetical protein ABEJ24_03555 [Candidatus Magasanikbacteria bacterium]
MNPLEKFKRQAQIQLKEKSSHISQEYLEVLMYWSMGICRNCKKDLEIEKYEKDSFQFACGHGAKFISINETISMEDSISIGSSGKTEDGNQELKVDRSSNWSTSKEGKEKHVVSSLCEFKKPEVEKVENEPNEDSDIDTWGYKNGKRKVKFQETSLFNQQYHRELSTKKEVKEEYTKEDIANLIKNAINEKLKSYCDPSDLILVIDTNPGLKEEFVDFAKKGLKGFLREADFKEIWLVGPHESRTYRLK